MDIQFAIQIISGFLKIVIDNSISILTLLLVIITGYYAWQTKKTVKEMELARRYQFIPSLKIRPTGDSIKIENIGLGPAKNIRGKIKLEPNGEEIEVVYPLLYPEKKFVLWRCFKNVKSYEDIKKFSQLILSVQFEDITNNPYNEEDKFIISDLEKIRNDDFSRDKITNSLDDIGRKLDEITRAIKDLK